MQTGPGRLSTLETARSGFRFTFERPRLIAVWALVSFAYNLLGSVFASATVGPSIKRILDMVGQADPNAAEPLLVQLAPTYAVLLASGLAVNAIYLAAVNRAVRPRAGNEKGYVGLGRDALLQFGLLLVLTAIGFGVVLALLLLSTGFSAVLAPALARPLGAGFALAGLGYVWVRFSLASPAAYASGRIDLAHAWTLTGGRLWALARIYLLVLLLASVVFLLGAVAIDKGLSAAFGGESRFDELAQLDFSSPAALLTPARLILAALQAILSALILPVLLCPPIEIYRVLTSPVGAAPAPTGGESPWG